MGAGTKGFDLKLFHEQVGYEGTDGGPHGNTMDLFMFHGLTLEEEVCVLRQISRRVTICWMDMLDLCGKVESRANLCDTLSCVFESLIPLVCFMFFGVCMSLFLSLDVGSFLRTLYMLVSCSSVFVLLV